ncbi:AAA family ATPase [Candidatus Spongiihabitans sp.]|uniref:AAA family ATPase n=1 Tax=Candidatus Spongiihabitans sp. TaxID=3101308 RepID=UPI003C7A3573
MTQIGDFNPFRPGTGQSPPYLAGRESEQGRLRQILAEMAAGRSPATDMVMYGPRGMGKTVLLNWLVDEAEKGGTNDNSIRTSATTPDELKEPIDMWNCLLSMDWKKRLKPSHWMAKLPIISATWESKAAASPALVNTLVKECKKQPLVFLMDEAHTMDAGLCRVLLNISQKVRKKAPFLLVLAGTPGLSHFLTTVGASFAERPKKMGIARLDEQSAADAIVKPLNEEGIKIGAGALKQVVEDSQCYPYFIQLWGEALWNLAKKNNLQKLTGQEVTIVKPQVEGVRQNFYSDRREDLKKDELLELAVNCAVIFQNQTRFEGKYIERVIKDFLPENKLDERHQAEALRGLILNEFIWQPPGADLYEAAIPSLMRYVLDKQREHVQKVSPASLA